MIKIINNNKIYDYEDKMIYDYGIQCGFEDSIVALKNNKLVDIMSSIDDGDTIEFVNENSVYSQDTLMRTGILLLLLAFKIKFPEDQLVVEYTIGNYMYLEFENNNEIHFRDLEEIRELMDDLINQNLRIERVKVSRKEAFDIFEEEGYIQKSRLLKSLDKDEVYLYKCHNHYFGIEGFVAPFTRFLKHYKLINYFPGVALSVSRTGEFTDFKEQKALSKIFSKSKKWTEMLDIGYVGSLNEKIQDGNMDFLVSVNEAYFENQISYIADKIIYNNARLVQISGPSSSGKTTMAERLSVQLAVRGKNPIPISMDNYFVNRVDTPLDEYGNRDYESINALDLKTFNRDLMRLLEGDYVNLPIYNFITGEREYGDTYTKLDKNGIIIVEGIHGLNPKLTSLVPDKDKYKIYVSALTQLSIDCHNRISTTDMRLMRRMVRDFVQRDKSVDDTLSEWPRVHAAEYINVFPYQNEADSIIDSSLIYEINILKKYVLKLVENYDKNGPNFTEIERLKSILNYFIEIKDDSIVPKNSILQEFIGDYNE